MGFLKKLDHHSGLIGTMADTVHVDLTEALQYGRITPMDLRNAVMACMGCEADGDCQDWLAEHREGARDTPAYCRNREMMLRLQHV